MRPALEHPNVTLLTNAQARQAQYQRDAARAVTEVVVEHDGQQRPTDGDIVVVSCGAANSAKLLLQSANDKHPNGLANGSDQVGRNYMFHNSVAVLAVSKEPNPTQFQKTLGLNDFYFGMQGFDYPMGNIQMVGKSQAPMYAGEKPHRDQAGADVHAGRDRQARRRLLALDRGPAAPRQPRHAWNATATSSLSYTPTNQVRQAQLYDKLKSMLSHLGMHEHLRPRATCT